MLIEGSRIMVVSDDAHFSDRAIEQLLRAGVRSIRFTDRCDAIAKIETARPDLVILHPPSEQQSQAQSAYQALQRQLAAAGIPVSLYPAGDFGIEDIQLSQLNERVFGS